MRQFVLSQLIERSSRDAGISEETTRQILRAFENDWRARLMRRPLERLLDFADQWDTEMKGSALVNPNPFVWFGLSFTLLRVAFGVCVARIVMTVYRLRK